LVSLNYIKQQSLPNQGRHIRLGENLTLTTAMNMHIFPHPLSYMLLKLNSDCKLLALQVGISE